jgi:hypothetical protein
MINFPGDYILLLIGHHAIVCLHMDHYLLLDHISMIANISMTSLSLCFQEFFQSQVARKTGRSAARA